MHIRHITVVKFNANMAGLRKVDLVLSQKGKTQVLLDGFRYQNNVTSGESAHWKDVTKTCCGKCTTVG